jgi:hypothetical protein
MRLATSLCLAALALTFCIATDTATGACLGVNKLTGQSQAVQEILRTGVSHPRRFFAEATHDRTTGRPQIIYYSRYAKAPGHFKSFVRNHECCHHAGHRDEIAANCCALRRMQLSGSGLAALRNYIVARDVNSQTLIDYAGQGSLFWSKTANRCLGQASN